MSKRKKSSPDTPSDPGTPPEVVSLPVWARRALSVFFVFHLIAIAACPLSVEPRSRLCEELFGSISWYANPLFLNHGYRFFAPDPGPAFLLRWEVETEDGRTLEATIPDLDEQWPRLFYHRHFMLSSRLQGPPDSPMVRSYARSYAKHLYEKYDARGVKLYLIVHLLPEPDQIRSGMKLDDPQLYREDLLYEYPQAKAAENVETPADVNPPAESDVEVLP